jgi:prepilin-type processing-associated H-X9-DG protein
MLGFYIDDGLFSKDHRRNLSRAVLFLKNHHAILHSGALNQTVRAMTLNNRGGRPPRFRGGRIFPGNFSFTMIEILIVITIIAVLVALLMPTLKEAKESANGAKCISNLRQIGLATEMYGQERSVYPWGVERPAGIRFTQRINPYLQKQGIVDSLTNVSGVVECPSHVLKHALRPITCYAVRDRLFGDSGNGAHVASGMYPRKFPWTERPNEVMLASDADQDVGNAVNLSSHSTIWDHPGNNANYSPATANTAVSFMDNTDGTTGQIRWRHKNRANFLFVDGHVESVGMNQFVEKYWRITGP